MQRRVVALAVLTGYAWLYIQIGLALVLPFHHGSLFQAKGCPFHFGRQGVEPEKRATTAPTPAEETSLKRLGDASRCSLQILMTAAKPAQRPFPRQVGPVALGGPETPPDIPEARAAWEPWSERGPPPPPCFVV